jgi:nucleoside-diphosphate-sugar epimerase
MNILVTGGAGRLAHYVCQEFSEHDLLLVDVVEPPEERGCAFRRTDLTSFEDCRAAIAQCEPQVILALGALPWPTDNPSAREQAAADGRGAPPPDTTMRVNVMGLYYLLTAAVEAGVETVIQTGFPDNSYNYSKIAGELMCKWFTKAHGIQTLVARPAWNWTPERSQEYARSVEPTTAWSPYLYHYVDTRDVAWAHRLMFDARDRLLPHDAFLVHAPDHTAPEDSRELVERFWPEAIGRIPVYLRDRQAFVSCEKAHNAFGYTPRYSWTDWL